MNETNATKPLAPAAGSAAPCPHCGGELPPIMWRSRTPAYIPEVSPERYARFSPKARSWYYPVFVQLPPNAQRERPAGVENAR